MGDNPVEVRVLSAALQMSNSHTERERFDYLPLVGNAARYRITKAVITVLIKETEDRSVPKLTNSLRKYRKKTF